MAAPIQVCLFALVATVNSQDIPLNFLDQALDKPPSMDLNRHRYPFGGFGLNIPNMFGPGGKFALGPLDSKELYDPQNLFTPIRGGFGMFAPGPSQYGDTAAPEPAQNNVHTWPENKVTDSFETARQDRPPAPVTEVDELDTKPEDAIINTFSTASTRKEIDTENPKIDGGPLKVDLLPEQVTGKDEPVLKTNKSTQSKSTVEPMLPPSLKREHGKILQTMSNEREISPEFVNITTTERSIEKIVFPDKVDSIKMAMNATMNRADKTNNLNIFNSTSSNNDVNISKNVDAVLIPVIPNPVSITNMGVNSNSMLVPLTTSNGQVNQVLPITNDIFPMTTTQKAITGNLPIQGILYTNVLSTFTQNDGQQMVAMPVKLSDVNNYPDNLKQNAGVPSDIPKNPVIAMLLTPANIQKVGSGSTNLVYNTQQQGKIVSAASILNNPLQIQPGTQIYTTNMQNFAQQAVPNSQLNTQNAQYYVLNGNTNNPVNGNNNNGQRIVLNLPGNLASNNPSILSSDNSQKYMLVPVNNQQNLPQNMQGNIYTLANSNLNGQTSNANALLVTDVQQSSDLLNGNGNNSGQSNLYTLHTLPNAVKNTGNNNLYVVNVPSSAGYQVQGTQGYSLVTMRDENKTKSLETDNGR